MENQEQGKSEALPIATWLPIATLSAFVLGVAGCGAPMVCLLLFSLVAPDIAFGLSYFILPVCMVPGSAIGALIGFVLAKRKADLAAQQKPAAE